MRLLKRIVTAPFVIVAAIIILLEDWLWDDLQRIAAAIGNLPIFRQVEQLILRLPRAGALALFLVPSVVLIPVKLLTLYFISRGHAVIGLGVVLAAKIAGTALVARLFTLTKPKLLTFNWFAWAYERIVAFRLRVYAAIQTSVVYIWLRAKVLPFRDAFRRWRAERRGWLSRRWHAVLRHRRRQYVTETESSPVETGAATRRSAADMKRPAAKKSRKKTTRKAGKKPPGRRR